MVSLQMLCVLGAILTFAIASWGKNENAKIVFGFIALIVLLFGLGILQPYYLVMYVPAFLLFSFLYMVFTRGHAQLAAMLSTVLIFMYMVNG